MTDIPTGSQFVSIEIDCFCFKFSSEITSIVVNEYKSNFNFNFSDEQTGDEGSGLGSL